MTTKEVKIKIIEAVNNIPEAALEEVLMYLNEIKDYSADEIKKLTIVSKILKEDDELLKKLAE